MMFGFADEMKQLIIGIIIINKMKMQDVNNLSSEEFIENFNNIFEKTSSIAISSEKKRPFNNKNDMIEVFINEFDDLDIDSKKKYSNKSS